MQLQDHLAIMLDSASRHWDKSTLPRRKVTTSWFEQDLETRPSNLFSHKQSAKAKNYRPGDLFKQQLRIGSSFDMDFWSAAPRTFRLPDYYKIWHLVEYDYAGTGAKAFSEARSLVMERAKGNPYNIIGWWPSHEKGFSHDIVVGTFCEYLRRMKNSLTWDSAIAEEVSDSVMRYVAGGHAVTKNMWLLPGLDAAKKFDVHPGIQFRLLSSEDLKRIPDSDSARFELIGSRDSEPLPFHLPAWVAESGSYTIGDKTIWPDFREQQLAIRAAVRLLREDECEMLHIWSRPDVPYRPEDNPSLYYWRPTNELPPEHSTLALAVQIIQSNTIKQVTHVGHIFDHILDADEPDHYLGPPLLALARSYEKETCEDELVDCIVGLESLVSNNTGEIRYRFALSIARVVGRTPEERLKVMHEAKRLYDYRSSLVHSGRVGGKRKVTPDDVLLARGYLRSMWWWAATVDQSRDGRSNLIAAVEEMLLK